MSRDRPMVQSVIRQPLRLGSADARGLALFALLYIALGLIGSGLRVSPNGIALLWPATGLLLSYLALSPRRRWPVIALVAVIAELLIDA
ncbi:MAG: MASE1 domain-containing protein, partial [Pseudomonadota bacterium]